MLQSPLSNLLPQKGQYFISVGYKKPIIGLKKSEGSLESRAVLALMALDYEPPVVKKAMGEQYERIENLFNGFYADDLKVKGG